MKTSIKQSCRSCACPTNNDIDDHTTITTLVCTAPNKSPIKLCDMFTICTSIPITKDDGLSDRICSECQTLLISAYDFRLKCIETDDKMRTKLEAIEISEAIKHEENHTSSSVLTMDSFDIKVEPELPKLLSTDDCDDDDRQTTYDDPFDCANKNEHNDSDFDYEDCLPLKVAKVSKKTKRPKAIKTASCNTCGKQFERARLKKHICIDEQKCLPIWVPAKTRSKKEHKCHVCGKLFDKNIRRERHLRFHDATGKPFECPTCKYRFATEGSMRRHEVKHSQVLANVKTIPTEPAQYSCTQCTASFSKQQSFASHMKTHKLANPIADGVFTCNRCPEKFVDSSEWRKHMMAHDRGKKEKKVVCQFDGCGQKFIYKSLLMDHIIRKHETTKPFTCKHCSKGL